MGTWGYKNFECDEAYDELGYLLQHIVSNIHEGFQKDKTDSMYGDQGDSKIIANIDILCTLCEHYSTGPEIDLSKAEEWRHDYLATYDSVFVPYAQSKSPEYVKKRRKEIVETFDRLYKILENLLDD